MYEKKVKTIFSLKTHMYPKWWVNYVFGCLKPFFKLLNHTNICTKFGSFDNRKKILILNHPTSGVNWVITIWFGQHTLFYIIKQKYDNIQYKKMIYMYY